MFHLNSASIAQDTNDSSILSEDEIIRLIQLLPSARELRDDKRTINSETATEEAKKFALVKINKAKEIVPKLKKAIKVKESLFIYKGLLAKGDVKYRKDLQEYSLYIGVYLRQHEGNEPYDFRIIFDESGIIKEVKKVYWKH